MTEVKALAGELPTQTEAPVGALELSGTGPRGRRSRYLQEGVAMRFQRLSTPVFRWIDTCGKLRIQCVNIGTARHIHTINHDLGGKCVTHD